MIAPLGCEGMEIAAETAQRPKCVGDHRAGCRGGYGDGQTGTPPDTPEPVTLPAPSVPRLGLIFSRSGPTRVTEFELQTEGRYRRRALAAPADDARAAVSEVARNRARIRVDRYASLSSGTRVLTEINVRPSQRP